MFMHTGLLIAAITEAVAITPSVLFFGASQVVGRIPGGELHPFGTYTQTFLGNQIESTINGVSGDTLGDPPVHSIVKNRRGFGIRLREATAATNYSAIVILGGSNDFKTECMSQNTFYVDKFKQSVIALIETAFSNSPRSLLLILIPFQGSLFRTGVCAASYQKMRNVYLDVASEYEKTHPLLFVRDSNLLFKSELDDLYCDQVHLNRKGNAELGKGVGLLLDSSPFKQILLIKH